MTDGAPRLVVDLAATSKNWALTPAGEARLRAEAPAGWEIGVVRAPTSFGPVSFVIRRHGDIVRIVVEPPPAPSLRLRLRPPSTRRIGRIAIAGRQLAFDRGTGTIRLPAGASRTLRLVARLTPG